MADLSVKIAGVEFPNPVIAASGTYGNGECFTDLYPLSRLGGISCKGMTIVPKMGNVPPRIAETPSGILNSVGLQNIGVHGFIEYYLPTLKEEGNVIIANVAGATIDDYIAAAEALDVTNVDMIELNISCPNVKAGGATWGRHLRGRGVRHEGGQSRNEQAAYREADPERNEHHRDCEGGRGGGRGQHLDDKHAPRNAHRYPHKAPDTPQQCRRTFRPGYIPGGSPMVWQCYNAVKIPIIGMGGISTWEDAVEMMMAGASAIQMGTAIFTDPWSPIKVIEGLNDYMDKNGIKDLSEIVGQVKPWD